MIDYDQPDEDPIVADVRRAREELSAQFHHDLRAIFDHYQKTRSATGRRYASPRDASGPAPAASKKVG